MASNEPESSPQVLAGKIVKKYFPEASGCMIVGSMAWKKDCTGANDIDLVIVAPLAYTSGVQNFDTTITKIDVTILPRYHFEYILLDELFNGRHMSSLIYALQQGEIIFDNDGRLAYYQSLTQLYQNGKHTLFHFKPEIFLEYVFSADKYLADYTRKTDILESFLLKEKLVNTILDMESLFNVGWLFQGKIKGRFLKTRNPEMAEKLESVLCIGNYEESRQALTEWACAYLANFRKLIDAYVPKYSRRIYHGNTFMLQFIDALAFEHCTSRLYHVLDSDPALADVEIYTLSRPFRVLNSHHYLIVLKGDTDMIQALLLTHLEETRDKFQFCQPGYQLLLEEFFGGQQTMDACQQYWILLCRERIVKSGSMNGIAVNTILLHIFFFTGMSAGYQSDSMLNFLKYLSECWLPYAYTEKDQVYLEKTGAMQQIHQKFAARLASQEDMIRGYAGYFISDWPNFDAEYPWQTILYTATGQLHRQLSSSSILHIPASEAAHLETFSPPGEKTWYIQKRQLEMVFSLFDENEKNWAFLVAFTIEVLKQGMSQP